VATFFKKISAEQFTVQVANQVVDETAGQSVTPTIDPIEKRRKAVKLAVRRNRERKKLKEVEVGLRDMNTGKRIKQATLNAT
jgi:hypothetical protein